MKRVPNDDVATLVFQRLSGLAERARIAHVNGYAEHVYFESPVNDLVGMLKRRCSGSEAVCKKKIASVINRLAAEGKIAWFNTGRGLSRRMKITPLFEDCLPPAKKDLKNDEPAASSVPVALLEDCLPPAEQDLKNDEPAASSVSVALPIKIRRCPSPTHPKGLIRRVRKIYERGDKYEARFAKLLAAAADIVHAKSADGDAVLTFWQSGKHNPKKGKMDIDDKHGADFFVSLVFNGEKREIIYDVKGNFLAAQEFNRNIRFYREQSVSLKRAIVVNPRRSDREIMEEIFNHLALVSGLDFGPHKESVIRQFM